MLQAFVSHPAACAVVALGAVLLNAEVDYCKETEMAYSHLAGAQQEEKCIAVAMLGSPCLE